MFVYMQWRNDVYSLPPIQFCLTMRGKSVRILMMLPLLMILIGCEIDNTSSSGGDESVSVATNEPASSTTTQGGTDGVSTNTTPDAAEWAAIEWLTSRAPSAKNAVPVMSLSAQIKSDGKVYFDWDQFPWSDDANGHFFVWTGDHWRGGKFEGIREGGQSIKLLSNIYSGYNGHTPPAPGTLVAFAWTDKEGRERSNLATTTWR